MTTAVTPSQPSYGGCSAAQQRCIALLKNKTTISRGSVVVPQTQMQLAASSVAAPVVRPASSATTTRPCSAVAPVGRPTSAITAVEATAKEQLSTAAAPVRLAASSTNSLVASSVPASIGQVSLPPALSADPSGVIICFGDSLTTGIRETGQSYPSILAGLLRSAGHDLAVQNAGNWGDTSSKMLQRLPRVISDVARSGRLAFILVLGGTNDILRGLGGAAQILGQLRQLHDIAGKAPYMPRVGVLTLPPLRKVGTWDQTRRSVNDGLRKICGTGACGAGAAAGSPWRSGGSSSWTSSL